MCALLRGYGRCIGLLILLGLPLAAVAQLTVIYDSGRTEPIAPYLKTLQAVEPPQSRVKSDNPARDNTALGPAETRNLLPIRSPGLRPGPLPAGTVSPDMLERLTLANAPPFFLIGSDGLSQRWLQSRRSDLQRLGAVGMLVQAETEADVRRIGELAQGLPITLGSASDIARALGLSRYPVLISKKGFEQ